MKFVVTMKDPDTLHDAIQTAVADAMETGLDKDEHAAVLGLRVEKAEKVCARWFEHGEYLTVEIDTETGTCVVAPVRRRP